MIVNLRYGLPYTTEVLRRGSQGFKEVGKVGVFEVKTLQKPVKKRGGVIRGLETLRRSLEGLGKGFEPFEGC